ncbi:MAG: TVP38/TMEM64 family protein [Gemmatimonadales bacterium]
MPRLHRPPVWRRAVALGLLTLALVAAASSVRLHTALLDVVEAARTIITGHPVWGAVAFVLLSALSAMLAFVSSAVLVPVALVTWGPVGCLALLWSGWILGGLFAYGTARWLGRPVVRFIASDAALRRYERRISPRTPFSMILLFQLALPSEIPGYVLGFARYPPVRYLIALALAELPFAIGTVYLGEGFLQRKTLLLIALGAGAVLFSVGAFQALHRRLGWEPAPGREGRRGGRDSTS